MFANISTKLYIILLLVQMCAPMALSADFQSCAIKVLQNKIAERTLPHIANAFKCQIKCVQKIIAWCTLPHCILCLLRAALHGANNMSGESGSDILLSIRPSRVPQILCRKPPSINKAPDLTSFQIYILRQWEQFSDISFYNETSFKILKQWDKFFGSNCSSQLIPLWN